MGLRSKPLDAFGGIPLAVKIVRVEDKAKRDQLINEIHTLFRISKSHFLIELYDA